MAKQKNKIQFRTEGKDRDVYPNGMVLIHGRLSAYERDRINEIANQPINSLSSRRATENREDD